MAKSNDGGEGEEPKPAAPQPKPEAQIDQPKGLGRASLDDVRSNTLKGDIRDLVLQELRDAKNGLPWSVRPEAQQREYIERVDVFAGRLIDKVVEAVAAKDYPSLAVKVDKYAVDPKGLKIQLSGHAGFTNLETMVNSVGDGGTFAHLVFADAEDFQGEREPIKPLPDQPSLMGDDDDDGGAVFDKTPSGKN